MLTSCSANDDNASKTTDSDPYVERWQGKTAKYTIMFYGCSGGNVDVQHTGAIPFIQQRLNVAANQVRFVVMYSMSKSDQMYREERKTTEPIYPYYGQ